jgi:hypothetical protein
MCSGSGTTIALATLLTPQPPNLDAPLMWQGASAFSGQEPGPLRWAAVEAGKLGPRQQVSIKL